MAKRSKSHKSHWPSCLTCCFYCGPSLHIIIFIFIPIILATLLMLSGVRWISVYIYKSGGETYKIGAASYSVGGNHLEPKWLYDTPSNWPSPVDQIPVLLLLHFVMALLLGTFLLFQLWRYVQVKKTEDIRIPKRKWIAFVQVLLGLLVFMLSCGDIIVWIIARNRHQDLNPDVLGYFMIIFGILLSAIWIFTVPAAYAYRWPTVQVQYQDPTTKQTTSEWKLRKLTSWDRLFGRSV